MSCVYCTTMHTDTQDFKQIIDTDHDGGFIYYRYIYTA